MKTLFLRIRSYHFELEKLRTFKRILIKVDNFRGLMYEVLILLDHSTELTLRRLE